MRPSRLAAGVLALVRPAGLEGCAPIFAMMLVFRVLGCIVDSLAIILIRVPLFAPIVAAERFDLVRFGIFVIVVTDIALVTPSSACRRRPRSRRRSSCPWPPLAGWTRCISGSSRSSPSGPARAPCRLGRSLRLLRSGQGAGRPGDPDETAHLSRRRGKAEDRDLHACGVAMAAVAVPSGAPDEEQ